MVTLLARNEEPLRAACEQMPGTSYSVVADLASVEQLKSAVADAVSRTASTLVLVWLLDSAVTVAGGNCTGRQFLSTFSLDPNHTCQLGGSSFLHTKYFLRYTPLHLLSQLVGLCQILAFSSQVQKMGGLDILVANGMLRHC